MSKRKLQQTDAAEDALLSTPSAKRSRRLPAEELTPSKRTPVKTPNKRVAQLVEESTPTPRVNQNQDSPSSRRSKANTDLKTPQKFVDPNGQNVYIVSNADRSARRRSARNLIEQTVSGELSDDEGLGGQSLAQEIFHNHGPRSGSDSENEEKDQDEHEVAAQPDTPSKSSRRERKQKRSPTPPSDLAPHERYFYDNRPSAARTSMNTLSAGDLISHAAYHEVVSQEEDTHAVNIEDLHDHHASTFPLWLFELSQQFSLCLYGYGSKMRILEEFASFLYQQTLENPPVVIMVNGMHPDMSLKSLLGTIASSILPKQQGKLPVQPAQLCSLILQYLESQTIALQVYILISAFHTKSLIAQQSLSILSQLATNPNVHLVITADNPSFPLLFPAQQRALFNFLSHDTTTFIPYDTGAANSELSTVVDTVLELIGRKTSAAAGREGVRWVLKSLPENARGLYRILISEILAAAAEGSAPAFDFDPEAPLGMDMDVDVTPSKSRARREQVSQSALPGVDAKILYQKAVEEFLCSSEMMFWSLLKEFVDHRMVVVRKERGLAGGGEMLGVEMSKEEIEGVLEDLLE